MEQTQAEENRQSVSKCPGKQGRAGTAGNPENALQAELTAYQTEREQLTQAIADSKEKRYRAAAQAERLEAEFETLQNKMWDEYEMTYSMAKKNSRPIQLQKAQQRAAQIHNELRQMEYVNPGAIEEYRRVRERHDFLFGQREDLNKARQDLERMIEELTEQMQTQFLQSFEQINQNFKRIFPLLFGGGNAELILQDKNNALSCDIEIVAQPPGKKPRYITLLSGGERALTAIALLFAMLEMRATPFCILDEIEAALDEENLVLFANFMKTYSSKTQFLVITH
ncbi:MAG: chromosome segregation protein SMC, partial [Christensenellales bacterium]